MLRHSRASRAGRPDTGNPAPGLLIGGAIYLLTVVVFLGSAHTLPYPDLNEKFSALSRLPDSDRTAVIYQEFDDRVRHELARAVPALAAWKQQGTNTRSSCEPPIDDDGASDQLPFYFADTHLSHAAYERSLRTIVASARHAGFALGPNDAAGSQNAHFRIRNRGGGDLNFFADRTRVGLMVNTGCNLTPEARGHGHPQHR